MQSPSPGEAPASACSWVHSENLLCGMGGTAGGLQKKKVTETDNGDARAGDAESPQFQEHAAREPWAVG